jgi:hypothetical protein
MLEWFPTLPIAMHSVHFQFRRWSVATQHPEHPETGVPMTKNEESEEPIPPFPSSICASNASPALSRTTKTRSLPSLDIAASLIMAASPSFKKPCIMASLKLSSTKRCAARRMGLATKRSALALPSSMTRRMTDESTVIVSHMGLTLGCAAPRWISDCIQLDNSNKVRLFRQLWGVLSLGVGDAMGAVVGKYIGILVWGQGRSHDCRIHGPDRAFAWGYSGRNRPHCGFQQLYLPHWWKPLLCRLTTLSYRWLERPHNIFVRISIIAIESNICTVIAVLEVD